MNSPKLERSPNDTSPIRQPATITTVGVRQRAGMAADPTTVGSIIEPTCYIRRDAAGTDYAGQTCSLARTLELVGERWTLLIVRDLFFGVRRFSDLQRHLDIPRAVLSARLAALVEAGIVEPGPYRLTERGEELWPAVHALMQWGERHHAPAARGACSRTPSAAPTSTPAGAAPPAGSSPRADALVMRPGPGATAAAARRRRDARAARAAAAARTAALRLPHRSREE